MQQFTVPQFIDVEDKIIGPITTRQFLVMLTSFIMIGISYKIFDFSAFVTFGLANFAISGLIAFLKINGRPFHYFILNFIQTNKRPYLRIWDNVVGKKESDYKTIEKTLVEEKPTAVARKFSTSRLAELSLIVDTQGAYTGEDNTKEDILASLDIKN